MSKIHVIQLNDTAHSTTLYSIIRHFTTGMSSYLRGIQDGQTGSEAKCGWSVTTSASLCPSLDMGPAPSSSQFLFFFLVFFPLSLIQYLLLPAEASGQDPQFGCLCVRTVSHSARIPFFLHKQTCDNRIRAAPKCLPGPGDTDGSRHGPWAYMLAEFLCETADDTNIEVLARGGGSETASSHLGAGAGRGGL